MSQLKKYTIEEAIKMLESKMGAGKAKHTHLKLSMDIEFNSGIGGATMFLRQLPVVINALAYHQSDSSGYSLNDTKIKDESYVETDLENNPDDPSIEVRKLLIMQGRKNRKQAREDRKSQ